jgi:methionyl-tRNA formyltransferase
MSSASADAPSLRPGEFTYFKPLRALLVGTGTQPILIQKLIPAGSKEQDAAGFWNGFGQRLEPKFFGTVQ